MHIVFTLPMYCSLVLKYQQVFVALLALFYQDPKIGYFQAKVILGSGCVSSNISFKPRQAWALSIS